ncbi:MAG: dTDP-4-dehydrorhamnose reductase [Alphaproteobacteria bacterium]|nr:dTDP-4-dehydrorhamnose reductase [Alphaproteobacteria bacterium]
MTNGARPILLIGGDGQLGGALRPALAHLGAVHAPDPAALDLASNDSILAALREIEPGLIVNTGAYTAVDRAESEPDLAMAVNGIAPGILATEARRLDATLVHFSTDYVFDGSAEHPYTEDDAPAPLNAYGRSKVAGENAITAAGGAYLVFRTSWLYSLRGANFLLTMRRLACEREELQVVDDQRGAPTWAGWVAESVAQILSGVDQASGSRWLGERAGIYHLTAAGATTWFGFTEAIIAHMRAAGEKVTVKKIVPVPTSHYPTPARRPAWSVLDCTKVRERFGIVSSDWREQLRRCLSQRPPPHSGS